MRTFRFLCLFVLLSTLSSEIFAQRANQIIQKTIAARGGAAAFASLQGLRMEIDIETSQMLGMTISGVSYRTKGNKMRNESEVMGMTFVQAYDGKVAWIKNPMNGNLEKISGEQLAMIKEQSYFDDLLIGYGARGFQVTAGADIKMNGRNYHHLIFEASEGKIDYYIDTETYLPYKSRNVRKELTLVTYYKEFQSVGKLKMPFVIEVESEGELLSKIICTKIELNPKVTPDMFAYPGK